LDNKDCGTHYIPIIQDALTLVAFGKHMRVL
jgi:hypothetical protein